MTNESKKNNYVEQNESLGVSMTEDTDINETNYEVQINEIEFQAFISATDMSKENDYAEKQGDFFIQDAPIKSPIESPKNLLKKYPYTTFSGFYHRNFTKCFGLYNITAH